jgi:ATP-dependent Zn protease
METDISTALHEAAHAVVAYRFGHVCGAVTIEPKDHYRGFALTEGAWADGSRDAEQVVVLFAGGAAQRHHDPSADLAGCGDDEEQAGELLALMPPGSETRLRDEADRMVRENWRAIECVAEALLEWRTLDSAEWDIIVSAVDDGDDWREVLGQLRINRGG